MFLQLRNLNDILAFADDTLIHAESLFEIRRAIAGLTHEIQRMGLEINPTKCSFITYGPKEVEEKTMVVGAFKDGKFIRTEADCHPDVPQSKKNTEAEI